MKTPAEQPKEYRITVNNAAAAASTTPKKMAECLAELGVPVHPDSYFSLGTLFCAIRVNCCPTKARRAVRQTMKQAVAKHFGPPDDEARKDHRIVRAWSGAAKA